MISKLKWLASATCIILYHVAVFYLVYTFENTYTVASCFTTFTFYVWYTQGKLREINKKIAELIDTNSKKTEQILTVVGSLQKTVIFCNSLKTKLDIAEKKIHILERKEKDGITKNKRRA